MGFGQDSQSEVGIGRLPKEAGFPFELEARGSEVYEETDFDPRCGEIVYQLSLVSGDEGLDCF